MHIVFFNRSFYPDTAATGQLLTELCVSLVQDHECKVTVIAGTPLISTESQLTTKKGYLLDMERLEGVTILRARGTSLSKNRFWGRITNYLTYFASACFAVLRLDRPDLVVALTDPPVIGLAAYLASKRFRVPLVISFRDIFPEVGRLLEDFRSETVNRILVTINAFLIRRTDCAIALGATMRKRLIEEKKADPAKTVVIPDWADCSQIAVGPKKNGFSEEHGLSDRFVVMHSGNIGLSQGLEIVIEAAARLSAYEIETVLVGTGVRRPALEQLACELALHRVSFLPFQPKERLTETFASADVFVISLKKGFSGYIVPSKLYSILASGRPYVAAVEEDCEVAAITREYECGLLAEPENAVDLAQKILQLYGDAELRRKLGTNARTAALRFDRRIQVQAYFELFSQLLSSPACLNPALEY